MRPKKRPQKQPVDSTLSIRFEGKVCGWVVIGAPGRKVVFVSKMDAENYCIQKLGKCPVSPALEDEYQDLPHRSVWTGAPWDHAFATLRC